MFGINSVNKTNNSDELFCRHRALKKDDEIIISGMSGRFPNSHNVKDFAENLYNKVDMVDDKETRFSWTKNIPKRHGKVYDIEKFDAKFFDIHPKLADSLHPQLRCTMEQTFEAVLDAGVNPLEISGSNTGVFSAVVELESLMKLNMHKKGNPYILVGESCAMLANRISYMLNLKGPSFAVDSACSSSMMALQCAYNAIRSGECDSALVIGSNLCLTPGMTRQFVYLGVLAADGYCRPFDEGASGYTRSEAICALFLQKRKDARRCYATLVHSKINCDGYKPSGITFPSSRVQMKLLNDFYREIKMDPKLVNYVEAHATGTIIGDPEECDTIAGVFCKNREEPLLVGSVKSNIGHSEATSGLCAVVKGILTFETGKIPPNINYNTPNSNIEPLRTGQLKVVSDVTDFKGEYFACNGYGFGGANGHVLLKKHDKMKIDHGMPTDDVPRIVLWSGRTEKSCNVLFDELSKQPLDSEFIALLHNIQSKSIPNHIFKGYGIFRRQNGELSESCIKREVVQFNNELRPIVWVFTGMGSQTIQMGKSLMSLPIFYDSIKKCHDILLEKGLNLIEILTSPIVEIYENIVHSIVGIVAVQIALVDVLKAIKMEPDFIIGHSAGEICCGYADNCLTLEETILAAYSRGMACIETSVIHGKMAAVDLGYQQLKSMLPSEIEIACHNGVESCTISGPAKQVDLFLKSLQDEGVFVKEVNSAHIPYHSHYISAVGPKYLTKLKEIIKCPKPRSGKWLSTSVSKINTTNSELLLCSAEYQTNNLLSPVLFYEAMKQLPANAIALEIAPQSLLQAIIKRNMPDALYVSFAQKDSDQNLLVLLNGLGRLYLNGVDMSLDKLYPPVEFPVSRSTQMISPFIQMGWDHSSNWYVPKFEKKLKELSGRLFYISLSNKEHEFIKGHVIGEKIIYPASGFLCLVWETFAEIFCGKGLEQVPVKFIDTKFHRATVFSDMNIEIMLTVIIHPGTGYYEISESDTIVVTGFVKHLEDYLDHAPKIQKSDSEITLNEEEFYIESELRNVAYNGDFKSICECQKNSGKIKWKNNLVTLIDGFLQLNVSKYDIRIATGIIGLDLVALDYDRILKSVQVADDGTEYVEMVRSDTHFILDSDGIRIEGVRIAPMPIFKYTYSDPLLESYRFVPYKCHDDLLDFEESIRTFVQIWLENAPELKPKIVEHCDEYQKSVTRCLSKIFKEIPIVTPELILLGLNEELKEPGVTVNTVDTFSNYKDCSVIVGENFCVNVKDLKQAANSCKDHSYIISRETSTLRSVTLSKEFKIISEISIDDYTLVLIKYDRKTENMVYSTLELFEFDNSFSWIEDLKYKLKLGRVYLVAYNYNISGILGLVNCLRKEPGKDVMCVFIDDDSAPKFDSNLDFYKNQLSKGVAFNVYRKGQWGSYRHLPLQYKPATAPQVEHYFASNLVKGDISSLSWVKGPLNVSDPKIVQVQYAALNFKDVVIASGRLDMTVFYPRLEQDCIIGFEYSGVMENGKRVMGITKSKALATHVKALNSLTWEVPENWSLEEAATVPVVYATVYLAFFIETQIEKGKSVLIHSGAGGIGLAAIQVALAYGLEVFTTVGTEDKKNYLLNIFPALKASHIGNSRDTSFVSMVFDGTNGKGVDFVLNSLTEEKLTASIKCLAHRGHFLEIGRYDILLHNKIGLGDFMRGISFHSIMLDQMGSNEDNFEKLNQQMKMDIQKGIIIPLRRTIFEAAKIHEAFRYMLTGKHIGKVLLKMREHNGDKASLPISVLPRIYFDPELSYVVIGGLGGFGLQLADWMILRGCRKIVLSSRKGVTTEYQKFRTSFWKTYGVEIEICTADVTTIDGCKKLLTTASEMGPVDGIFNLAAVLNDRIFENQTPQTFSDTFAAKVKTTQYLDKLSREMYPKMKYFVVFSSISCGRGNPGQSNYGMANSGMERIIEARTSAGYFGKAIQWGLVATVGLAASSEKFNSKLTGIEHQKMSSCLFVLDYLLSTSDPVVASTVVAEKSNENASIKLNFVEFLNKTFNIKALTTEFKAKKLYEVGMDSLVAVELIQVIERDYGLTLSSKNMRNLTIQDLIVLVQKANKPQLEID